MTKLSQDASCLFLELPQEVRDNIIGEVIFPGEDQPNDRDLIQDNLGLATTATRQIFPYDGNRKDSEFRRDLSILRTCSQLQIEGEYILYGTSSFNLMYHDWSDPIKKSYDFFQHLPPRLRKLVQRIERKCYSKPYQWSISLFDWCAFTKFLAQECPNLHSLVLWGPGDYTEGEAWVKTCEPSQKWVQALLEIKTLRHFEIAMIPGGSIYKDDTFKNQFMPWLRHTLTHPAKVLPITPYKKEPIKPFRFFDLPRKVRNAVYRCAVLPRDRHIHIGIGSWYDKTTRDAFNLIQGCWQLYLEVSLILYSEGIFTTAVPKYNRALMTFMKDHYSAALYGSHTLIHKPWPIKHLAVSVWNPSAELKDLPWLVKQAEIESLELTISDDVADEMIIDWDLTVLQQNGVGLWQGDFTRTLLIAFAHIPHLRIKATPVIQPDCLEWIETKLRKQLLRRISTYHNLEWLYSGLNRNVKNHRRIRYRSDPTFKRPW